MDAMMIVVGLMAAGLGGYMAIWPEAAARGTTPAGLPTRSRPTPTCSPRGSAD